LPLFPETLKPPEKSSSKNNDKKSDPERSESISLSAFQTQGKDGHVGNAMGEKQRKENLGKGLGQKKTLSIEDGRKENPNETIGLPDPFDKKFILINEPEDNSRNK